MPATSASADPRALPRLELAPSTRADLWTVVKGLFTDFAELRALAKKLGDAWSRRSELAYVRNPTGATLDGGRIIIDGSASGQRCSLQWLNGQGGTGLWRGRERGGPHERAVLVSYSYVNVSALARYDATLRYAAAGIAPLLYFGYLDGVAPLDEAKFRRMRQRNVYPHLAVAEERPAGEPLWTIGSLSPAEVIRLGLGLCDTLLSLDGLAVLGLRPESVFVAGEPGQRYYAGAAPRTLRFAGYGEASDLPVPYSFDPPTYSAFDRGADELVYTVAVMMWFSLLGTFAFRVGVPSNDDENKWTDRRAPFTGPPELGRLLEAVLVADVSKRMKAPELREELARLAARWGVEEPAFPPVE